MLNTILGIIFVSVAHLDGWLAWEGGFGLLEKAALKSIFSFPPGPFTQNLEIGVILVVSWNVFPSITSSWDWWCHAKRWYCRS